MHMVPQQIHMHMSKTHIHASVDTHVHTHTRVHSNSLVAIGLFPSLLSNSNQSHFLQQLRLLHSNWSDRPSNNNIITHLTSLWQQSKIKLSYFTHWVCFESSQTVYLLCVPSLVLTHGSVFTGCFRVTSLFLNCVLKIVKESTKKQ